MSGMSARPVQSEAEIKLTSTKNFVDMLNDLKFFMKDDKALTSLGQKAASALSLTDEEHKKHAALMAEADEARKTLEKLKVEKEFLEKKHKEIDGIHAGNISKLQEYKANIDAVHLDKEQFLKALEDKLKSEQTFIEDQKSDLSEKMAEYSRLKIDQDNREASLKKLQAQIDDVKSSLSIKG